MNLKRLLLIGLGLALLAGCGTDPTPAPAAPAVAVAPAPLAEDMPTLIPTFTPLATTVPLPTPTPAPPLDTAVSAIDPAIPFDQIIVSLRYMIPGLGLDRRLQGNAASRITMVDGATGQVAEYNNQGGVLLEMRQALPLAELEPAPDGCEFCVYIEYELSLEEASGAGWLQDDVLLASIENYMTIALGPHFPPQTIVGLRRSASPYAPAHTVALSEDGRLWGWLATDGQIAEPLAPISTTQQLRFAMDTLPLADLNEQYVASCAGSSVEALFLNPGGEAQLVSIVCPEFSLPAILLPLYLQLDELLAELVTDVSLPRPQAAFPLAALLDYRRVDGARLTLYQDGRIIALDAEATPYTSTLTMPQTISLTTSLLDSGELSPGLSTFEIDASETITVTPEATSVLLLRGPDMLYDGEWANTAEIPALAELDALLDTLLGLTEPEAVETPELAAAGSVHTALSHAPRGCRRRVLSTRATTILWRKEKRVFLTNIYRW